jgi:hypothetical protein
MHTRRVWFCTVWRHWQNLRRLLKPGIEIGETGVSKYMVRRSKPPSQTWRTFLDNHVESMVSVGFFAVPTIRKPGGSTPIVTALPRSMLKRRCQYA